jgi:hypothetical protein
MASCAEEQGGWAELPEELLLTVLDKLEWKWRESAAVRRMCSRWRRIHDAGLKRMELAFRATDESVMALCARMPSLTKVDLWCSEDLTDEGLRAVVKLESLTSLSGCPLVTDEGLRAVTGLESLTELNLSWCSLVTDNGLRAVAELKSLTNLDLWGCSLVTDNGLQAVAELKSLEHLDLVGCSLVTDEGLRAVAELKSLTELDLGGCSEVTDVGLRHLSGLNQLTYLCLDNCETSQSAEEELCRQIPGLYIEHYDEYDEDDWAY